MPPEQNRAALERARELYRVVERWQAADMLGLMGQLGAIPEPG